MSVKSRPRRGRQIPEWLKDRGLLLVTLTGVVLYFFLSVPAAIFYGRFGVSAGEVGISYASLLSGSTVEILLVVVILACALIVAAYLLAFVVAVFYIYFVYLPYILFHAGLSPFFKKADRLSDQQFERWLAADLHIRGQFQWLLQVFQTAHPNQDMSIAATESERWMRHGRDLQKKRRELRTKLGELRKQGTSAPDVAAQLELIDSQINVRKRRQARNMFQANYLVLKAAIQHWGRVLIIGFVLVTVVVLLPVLAIVQAGEVRDGKTYFGKNTGAFDYHADLVKVTPSSDHPAPSIQALRGEQLFLLGENAQYAVLYSPSGHSTIRVPISSVVISSVG